MDLSDRTKNYFSELIRLGENFNYLKWLEQVRAQEAQRNKSTLDCDSATNDKASRSQLPAQLQNQQVLATKQPQFTAKYCGYAPKLCSVDQDLKNVCDAWDDVQKNCRRDAIYVYLSWVFSLVRKYRRRGKLNQLICRAQKRAGIDKNDKPEPYSAVIRATTSSRIDRRAISKYSRVLQFARRSRKGRPLKTFIKSLGGLNICATLAAAQRINRASRKR